MTDNGVPSIAIRALEPSEWALFRDFRLNALKAAPGVFGGAYDTEVNDPPEKWQRIIKGQSDQVFGLFDEERLIGITAAFARREDPSGETAALAMSFILPEYRGRGLSRLCYETRLAWIRTVPQFKRVLVSHRKSNEASRRANAPFGFKETHRAPRVWPDGTTDDQIFYELLLTGSGDHSPDAQPRQSR